MNNWELAWKNTVGLPPGTPQWLVAVVALLAIYITVVVPSSTLLVILERKLSADLQARVGPNRAGPSGIFQPLADLLKLLQKESRAAPARRSRFWLGVHTMATYSTIAVLPLGSLVVLVDTDMSVFLPFWAVLVLSLGTLLVGLSQQSVPSWFGGIRVASQALAGAFPALISILCAGIRAGGFRWNSFAVTQGASPFSWAALGSPFEFLAFVVFMLSGLVILGVPPMDGGHSIPDIHGGVSSLVYGRRQSLYRLSRFYSFFMWSVLATVLFLGGWNLPEQLSVWLKEIEGWYRLQLLELGVLLAKTFILMTGVVLVASVTPRLRSDQVTDLAWRVLSPFSLFALAGTAVWFGWRVIS